jgi:hypothetical protein
MARVFAALALGAAADTVTNCGADTDHLKITSVVTDVDATGGPRKGNPFVITVEGEFDEPHQHGRLFGDLNILALGVVKEDVPFNQKYDFYPGMASGPTKVVIGPFTFPRAVPGEVNVTGRIGINNEKEEPVLCLDVALIIPKILAEEEPALESSDGACGDSSSDHIQNIQSDTVDDVTTTTMDLDEDLGYVNLKVDIGVKAPVVPKVNLKLTQIPISLSPAIPAGQLKFVGYPHDSLKSGVQDLIDVTGNLILEDTNGDEVVCIGFSDDANAISV